MSRSDELFERALKIIPGGVNSPVRSFQKVGRNPIYFARAQGAHLWDVDGKQYTDFCLSFGPHLLGHCPPPVVEALHRQADLAQSFGANHERELELAEYIVRAYPVLDKVRTVNSGTEAVMTAVRVARGFSGRDKIVVFEGCYHGHSDGLLAKAGSGVAELSEAASKGVPQSIVAETINAKYDDLDGLKKIFEKYGSQIAAILLEPVPANHGLHIPTREHLQSIIDIAHAAGSLVIFDEVISGFRLGLSGASGLYDLKPDIVTLGKIVGGGLPLAALVGRTAIMDCLAPLGPVYQAGTLSGNPMAAAAGCAVMQTVFENPPYAELAKRTEAFAGRLREVYRLIPEFRVKNLGSLFWIHFEEPQGGFPPEVGPSCQQKYRNLFHAALKEGVYFAPSPFEVGFLSTAHTDEVLDEVVEKLSRCVP